MYNITPNLEKSDWFRDILERFFEPKLRNLVQMTYWLRSNAVKMNGFWVYIFPCFCHFGWYQPILSNKKCLNFENLSTLFWETMTSSLFLRNTTFFWPRCPFDVISIVLILIINNKNQSRIYFAMGERLRKSRRNAVDVLLQQA